MFTYFFFGYDFYIYNNIYFLKLGFNNSGLDKLLNIRQPNVVSSRGEIVAINTGD